MRLVMAVPSALRDLRVVQHDASMELGAAQFQGELAQYIYVHANRFRAS